MSPKKNTKKASCKIQKSTGREPQLHSTENEFVSWCFDRIDRNGDFAFDIQRDDFDSKFILGKMIAISNMTWRELKRATHDNAKGKNHEIDADNFSAKAKRRFRELQLDEEADALFSIAISNKIRIFGTRRNAEFHPIWYDPNHEVCPSNQ